MEKPNTGPEIGSNLQAEEIKRLEDEIAILSQQQAAAEEEAEEYENMFEEETTGDNRRKALANLKKLERASRNAAAAHKKAIEALRKQLKGKQPTTKQDSDPVEAGSTSTSDPVPEPTPEELQKAQDVINLERELDSKAKQEEKGAAGSKKRKKGTQGDKQRENLSPWNEILQSSDSIDELKARLAIIEEDRAALVKKSTALLHAQGGGEDTAERKDIEAQLRHINDNDIIARFKRKIKALEEESALKTDPEKNKKPKEIPKTETKTTADTTQLEEVIGDMGSGLKNFAEGESKTTSFPEGFEPIFIEKLDKLATALETTTRLGNRTELRRNVQKYILPETLAALSALDTYEKDKPAEARITPEGIATFRTLLIRVKDALADIHELGEKTSSGSKKEGTKKEDKPTTVDKTKKEEPKAKELDFATAIKEDAQLRTAGNALHFINTYIVTHRGDENTPIKDNLFGIDTKTILTATAEVELLKKSLPAELGSDKAVEAYVQKVADRCTVFIGHLRDIIDTAKDTNIRKLYSEVFGLSIQCVELGIGDVDRLKKPKPAPAEKKLGTEPITTEEELNKAIDENDPRLTKGTPVKKLNGIIALKATVTTLTASQTEPVAKDLEFLASVLPENITVGSKTADYIQKNILKPCIELNEKLWELSDTPPTHLARLRAANEAILVACVAAGYIKVEALKKPEPATAPEAEPTPAPTPEAPRFTTSASPESFIAKGGPDVRREKEYIKFKAWLDANIELGVRQESVKSARALSKTESDWFTIYRDQAETIDTLQKLSKEGLLDAFGATPTREDSIRRQYALKHLIYEMFTDPSHLVHVKILAETIVQVKENSKKITELETARAKLIDQLDVLDKTPITQEQLTAVYSPEHMSAADTRVVTSTMEEYLDDITRNYTKDLGSSTESTGNIGSKLFNRYHRRVRDAGRGRFGKFLSGIGSLFTSEITDITNPVIGKEYARFNALLKILRDNQLVERRTSPVVSVDDAAKNMLAFRAYVKNPSDPTAPENIKRAYGQMFKLIAPFLNLALTDTEKEDKAKEIREKPLTDAINMLGTDILDTEAVNSSLLYYTTFPSDQYKHEIGFYVLESDMDDIIRTANATANLSTMYALKDIYEPVAHTMETSPAVPETTKIKFSTVMKAVAKSVQNFIEGGALAVDDLDVMGFVIDVYSKVFASRTKPEKKKELLTKLKTSLQNLVAGLIATGGYDSEVAKTQDYIIELEKIEGSI